MKDDTFFFSVSPLLFAHVSLSPFRFCLFVLFSLTISRVKQSIGENDLWQHYLKIFTYEWSNRKYLICCCQSCASCCNLLLILCWIFIGGSVLSVVVRLCCHLMFISGTDRQTVIVSVLLFFFVADFYQSWTSRMNLKGVI